MSRARRSSPTTCKSRISLCRHARRGQEGPRDKKDPRPETKKEVPPLPHRRCVLGAFASRPVLGPRAGVGCASPAGCQPAWCQTTRPTLAPSLAPGLRVREAPVRQPNVGGADGFTGANEFDVRTTPDGRTASASAAPGVIRVAAAHQPGPKLNIWVIRGAVDALGSVLCNAPACRMAARALRVASAMVFDGTCGVL